MTDSLRRKELDAQRKRVFERIVSFGHSIALYAEKMERGRGELNAALHEYHEVCAELEREGAVAALTEAPE